MNFDEFVKTCMITCAFLTCFYFLLIACVWCFKECIENFKSGKYFTAILNFLISANLAFMVLFGCLSL